MSDKKESHSSKHDRAIITTGPFLIPLEVDSEIQMGRDNDRLIIILTNPTSDKKLQASITLGVFLQPEVDDCPQEPHDDHTTVYTDIQETLIDLGTHIVQPHTTTRIERNIPGSIGIGPVDERNAVYRVTAKGDFAICKDSCQPKCGLLEISVVAGSIFNPDEPGLEQADPVTFFQFHNFVSCNGK